MKHLQPNSGFIDHTCYAMACIEKHVSLYFCFFFFALAPDPAEAWPDTAEPDFLPLF